MKRKCPECGFELGDFLYADACPNRHEVLKHNQARPAPSKNHPDRPGGQSEFFLTIVHIIES